MPLVAAPPLVRAFMGFGLAFFAVTTLYLGAGLIVPVVEALVVWFVLNAVAKAIMRLPIIGPIVPRGLALTIGAFGVFVLGYLIVDSSIRTASSLGSRAQGLGEALDQMIVWASDLLGVHLPGQGMMDRAFGALGLESAVRQIVTAVYATISQFSVVAVYVVFLLVDQKFFPAKLQALIPDAVHRKRTEILLHKINRGIQSYLKIMTFVSLLTAVLSYAVMRWVGLEYATFWAVTIFLLNFIPTIGTVVATVLPTLFALLQFQEVGQTLVVLVGIGLVQFFIGNMMLPRLSSSTLNISLFVTMFALLFWGALWGITGMFVALPLTAMIIITFSHFKATLPFAILLSRDGAVGDGLIPETVPEGAGPH